MKHWFDDNYDHYAKIVQAINAWKGTPYQHGGDKKGIGVDCVHFVMLFSREIEIITELTDPGKYPVGWYLKGEDAIVDGIDWYMDNAINPRILHTVENASYISRPGDLICFKIKSPICNHVGLKLDRNRFIHTNTRKKQVSIESIEGYKKYIVRFYAFWEKE